MIHGLLLNGLSFTTEYELGCQKCFMQVWITNNSFPPGFIVKSGVVPLLPPQIKNK